MKNRYLGFILVLIAVFWPCVMGAQISIYERVGDKRVMCSRSGLTSNPKDCGVKAYWYTYVFVGSISAITPIEQAEREIKIVPEEVFRGTPSTPLTVLTSQRLCLPKLAIGDRWLFYLRKQKSGQIVLDYGTDSLPIANAREQIETLRRLKTIGDFGIVRGQVLQGSPLQGKPVPGAKVTARRVSDGLRFSSTTRPNGQYEFRPIPPGEYTITVRPVGSFRPDDSTIDVSRGVCWDLALTRSSHAQIGGHVIRSDGSPAPGVGVVLIRPDDSFETTQTNRGGHYEFYSLEPGQFVVGVNFPARSDWFYGSGGGVGTKIPPSSLFYPGVTNRSSAGVIRLRADQRLDNIDFFLRVQ